MDAGAAPARRSNRPPAPCLDHTPSARATRAQEPTPTCSQPTRPSLCPRRAPVRSSPRVNGAVTLYYSPWKKSTPFMAAMKHPTTSALPPSLYKTRAEPFSSPSHSRTPFSTPNSPSRSRSPHSRARRRPNRSSPSSPEFVLTIHVFRRSFAVRAAPRDRDHAARCRTSSSERSPTTVSVLCPPRPPFIPRLKITPTH
jgi:hypothetical protein